jgi:hypothetical protein
MTRKEAEQLLLNQGYTPSPADNGFLKKYPESRIEVLARFAPYELMVSFHGQFRGGRFILLRHFSAEWLESLDREMLNKKR